MAFILTTAAVQKMITDSMAELLKQVNKIDARLIKIENIGNTVTLSKRLDSLKQDFLALEKNVDESINTMVESINGALSFDEGNLTALITIDTANKEVGFTIGQRSFKAKVSNAPVVPVIPLVFDPTCKKAAEAYINENLDLKKVGMKWEDAASHYETHGKFEGRSWKSELCK